MSTFMGNSRSSPTNGNTSQKSRLLASNQKTWCSNRQPKMWKHGTTWHAIQYAFFPISSVMPSQGLSTSRTHSTPWSFLIRATTKCLNLKMLSNSVLNGFSLRWFPIIAQERMRTHYSLMENQYCKTAPCSPYVTSSPSLPYHSAGQDSWWQDPK